MASRLPKGLIQGAWGRRWFRRITYLLISGAACTGGALWTVRQPFFNRWLIGKLDAVLRDETGLALTAGRLEFDPFQGRIILRDLTVGGDLLTAERLEIQADLSSLLGRYPHLWNIELENPSTILDARRLSMIRLKEKPKQAVSPEFTLDRVKVVGGKLQIEEPAWKLPHAEFTYQIDGRGLGPNRIFLDVRLPTFMLRNDTGEVKGSLSAQANLSDRAVELKDSTLRVGNNQLFVKGNYAVAERLFSTEIKGRVDIGESLRLADPRSSAAWSGMADFEATAKGPVSNPIWDVAISGKGLRVPRLQPGDVAIKANGSLRHATFRELTWNSSQGSVQATGDWKHGAGSHVQFHGERIGLAPLAAYARTAFLEDLSLNLTGQVDVPGDPWMPQRINAISLQAEGEFLKQEAPVGNLTAQLDGGVLTLGSVVLKLPQVEFEGSSTLTLTKDSLHAISAKAQVNTDASLVADVLHRWDIGEGTDNGQTIKLGMGGRATARAEVTWDPFLGVRLKGDVHIEEPRWHGATMDQLRAEVTIQGDELRVEHLEAEKAGGTAQGDIWLTWRDLPPGQDAMEMHFQANRLPIEEGLKAADVGDIPITGLGSGWARIHGPYDRLMIEAETTAEQANVYGLSFPFVAGNMVYDIMGDRIMVNDARVAETAQQLGSPDEDPTGLLALRGQMDMDLKRETWQVWGKGQMDSKLLGLPGPEFQAQIDARFEGPWTRSFGPLSLPLGTVSFQRGRLFFGQQSLEGFEGSIDTREGAIHAELKSSGKSAPLVTLNALPKKDGLTIALNAHVAPDSADTAHLAASLTQDLLQDGRMDLTAEGFWNEEAFRWQGRMDRLVANFDGFDFAHQEPITLAGDTSGMTLDMRLRGAASARPEQTAPEGSALMWIHGSVPFSASRPVDVKLEGTTELAYLKGVLDDILEVDEYSLLADLKPEGSARFDLALGGPFLEPTLDGLLSLRSGRLQIRTYPQSVEDLSFNLHFKNHDVILLESDPLRGRVAQGAFRAWGTATWEFGGLSVYDLQTRLDDFQLRDLPEGFELYGSLDAVLQGTKEEGGILSGSIRARRMAYQADINLRDLILASAMGGSSLHLGVDPNDPLTHIDLDLDLTLSEPWEIDTNLLKVQGRPTGTFKILGTLAEPGLKGKMDLLPGGRLTNLLPAGDVVLERGSIEWTNPQIRYPNLDLQGRVDVPPYLVNLGIRGNLDGLDIKQTSTPALRQDEIMAILIDPSLAPSIGSVSGPASQTAITYGLANTGSGLLTTLALANFQESVRRTFKLDRVNVAWRTGGGTGASETSVTVGKSINFFGTRTPLVFTHQKSGDTATTSGQVEWRFGNFVLQLGVSQSGLNGVAPSGEIRHTWSPGW